MLDDGAHCHHLVITADYVAAITVTTCCYAFAAHPMGRWWHYVFLPVHLSVRMCACICAQAETGLSSTFSFCNEQVMQQV